jgi:two-component system osmolarity sensor histidine kinase EnvZ
LKVFPNTLFAKTSLTISSALLIFILFTGFVVLNYILLPVGKQSSTDLAALVVLSAKTWVELPPGVRADFQQELEENHDLILRPSPPATDLTPLTLHSPYMSFLEEALGKQFGYPVHIHTSPGIPDWYWAILSVADKELYIGVPHAHIGAEPPRAAFIILLGASLFILLTTLLVVRRITKPLETLSLGVKNLGRKGKHAPLPEKGPEELAELARKFNQLSNEVQQLLDNRTTLLGGISHDLRTPLARLGIAIELLQGKEDPALLQSIQCDLGEMDNLITRTLELAKMMGEEDMHSEPVKLDTFFSELQASYLEQEKTLDIRLDCPQALSTNKLVLQRVLNNLIDNAFNYSKQQPVSLHAVCNRKQLRICVLDQGDGIPTAQLEKVFQPFYRLDISRNTSTGGSGLGLAIVQQLATMQGWEISLKNRSEGGLSACINIVNIQKNSQKPPGSAIS